MAVSNDLDAHAKPPAAIRDVYKVYQKLDARAVGKHPDVIDAKSPIDPSLKPSNTYHLPNDLRQIFMEFTGTESNGTLSNKSGFLIGKSSEDSNGSLVNASTLKQGAEPAAVFEVSAVPGLFIYSGLLPPEIQLQLLDKMLHRDLCNPDHKTNLHLHYDISYPPPGKSYFDLSPDEKICHPHYANVHKPLTTQQFLNKKLRWMTLGGQYDWTNKVYPSGKPPSFPTDIKVMLEDIFPMKAEAAIVNLYSPGDTLSLHRDVSEECDQPLVSISLGCDGIFVIGLEGDGADDRSRVAVLRLRSGDAVLMSGESRYAWHSVPKVLEGTCPEWMEQWPFQNTNDEGEVKDFEQWTGWMKGKRVNLNVRQMFAS